MALQVQDGTTNPTITATATSPSNDLDNDPDPTNNTIQHTLTRAGTGTTAAGDTAPTTPTDQRGNARPVHGADMARTLTFVGVRRRPDRWNDFRLRPLVFALVRGRIVHTAEVVSSSLASPTLCPLGSRPFREAAGGRSDGANMARDFG